MRYGASARVYCTLRSINKKNVCEGTSCVRGEMRIYNPGVSHK
uniref:Uncharacterized protein n=1 Tax=virus sp. ct1Uu26 TaxID=2826789 RepID=A0A8S5R825_9VIRU|nr:MAG TPA: hypothetical protein [virus sp. ct1Uu26]